MRWVALSILLALETCPARAQEIHGLVGVAQDTATHTGKSSWQIEYREGLGEHFAFGFSTVNEGHFPDHHHRDGHSVQFWSRTSVLDRRLSLDAGIGPYYYYDTVKDPAGNLELNDHGLGYIASLSATWYTESRWLLQLRTNWIGTRDSIDTMSAQLGIGYQLDPPPSPGLLPEPPLRRGKTTNNEITAFIGETSVHNEGSSHSLATGIEYRRGLWRNVDWTIAWLYEGENGLTRRQGLVTQLWAARAVLGERVSFHVGAGPYFAVDGLRNQQNDRDDNVLVTGVVTISSSYRFHPQWGIRASWNRIVTNYNRDADVYLAGIGYRF
jgi:hypothetical protein